MEIDKVISCQERLQVLLDYFEYRETLLFVMIITQN